MMALMARLLRGFSGFKSKATVAPVHYPSNNTRRTSQSTHLDSDDEDGPELCIPVTATTGSRRRAALEMHQTEVQMGLAEKEPEHFHPRCSIDSCCSNSDDIDSRYTDMVLIHRGRNAMVYRARHRRTRARIVLKHYPAAACVGARAAARDKEARMHRLLAGVTGVVPVKDVAVISDGTYIVMEACNGGTLIEAIANAGGKLPERQAAVKVALPLLHVVQQLHSLGIVHRHIRPEHLLISHGQLLLGDLSAAAVTRPLPLLEKPVSRVSVELLASSVTDPVHGAVVVDTRLASVSGSSNASSAAPGGVRDGAAAECASKVHDSSGSEVVDVLNHRVGSIEYMAPEMLSKPTSSEVFHLVLAQGIDEDDLPVYDEKVDIWSIGVVLFEAVTGHQPFLADTAADMAAVIGQRMRALDASGVPEFMARHHMSPECQQLLLACLNMDPAKRPSAEELLNHPWLRQSVAAYRTISFDSRKSSGGVPPELQQPRTVSSRDLTRTSSGGPLRRSMSLQVPNDTPTSQSLRSRTSRSIGLRPSVQAGLCPA